MDSHTMNYIRHINPFIKEDDVEEVRMVNDFDLYVKLIDGRKYLYDTLTGYFRGILESEQRKSRERLKMEFKRRLRTLMNRRRITQDDLADILGLSRATINRYVNGDTVPDFITMQEIATILNYPLDEFTFKEY